MKQSSTLLLAIAACTLLTSCGAPPRAPEISSNPAVATPVVQQPKAPEFKAPVQAVEKSTPPATTPPEALSEPSFNGEPRVPGNDPLFAEKEKGYFIPDNFILTAKMRKHLPKIKAPGSSEQLELEALACAIRNDREKFDKISWIMEEGLAADYRSQLGKLRFEPSRAKVMQRFMETRENFADATGKLPESMNYDITEAIKEELYIESTEAFLEKKLTESIASGQITLTSQGKALLEGSAAPDKGETLLASFRDSSRTIRWNDIAKLNFPLDLIPLSDAFRIVMKRKIMLTEGREMKMVPSDIYRITMASNLVDAYLDLILGPPPSDFNPQDRENTRNSIREPSEKELLDFYSSNLTLYTPPRTDWIQWISFSSQEKAQSAIESLAAGVSFEAVALEQEQGNQPPDGFPASNLDWDIDSIVSKMAPGTLSRLIAVDDKWIILKLVHRQESLPISFENARPAVRQDIINQDWKEKRSKCLEELRIKALELLWKMEPWPSDISGEDGKEG